jgi:hypothetical protein
MGLSIYSITGLADGTAIRYTKLPLKALGTPEFEEYCLFLLSTGVKRLMAD